MNMRTNIEMQQCVELRRDEVARRTLRLWKAAGRPTGRDLEYWLQAEVELLAERQHCRPQDRTYATAESVTRLAGRNESVNVQCSLRLNVTMWINRKDTIKI